MIVNSPADSTPSVMAFFEVRELSNLTVKTRLFTSNSCFRTPFSSSRALPIEVGQPIQRIPPLIIIPSTLKAALMIRSSPLISSTSCATVSDPKMRARIMRLDTGGFIVLTLQLMGMWSQLRKEPGDSSR